MNKISLIILTFLAVSCNTKTENISESSNVEDKKDSINIKADSIVKKSTVPKTKEIEIPAIGKFELTQMKIDSSHKYGAGDCFGRVTKYSFPQVGLGIDSMDCSDYGYTYTHYLLTNKNTIQVVHRIESESFLKPKAQQYSYVLTEKIVDFNEVPATISIRSDTVEDHHLDKIKTNFIKDTLTDTQTSWEHWEMEYNGAWEMELDEL